MPTMPDISKKTILLVEDDSTTAEIISIILKKNSFDVLTAATGEEAIRIVSSGQMIHLILMDIILESNMDGIEAAKIILQNHDIPLIFLSGYSDMETLQRAEEIASYGYVLKHSGQFVLIASIKMALNLYEARRKVRKQENELQENTWFKNIILETVSDGVITIDENGIILFVNKMIETIFGYGSSELTGRNITMLMPPYLRDNHSNSLDEYIKSGQRHLPSWSAIHVPGLHKEGFEVSLEISLGENIFQGQKVFCGIIKDITERRQAEASLKEREKAFRAMFADNPVPMLVYEPETLRILEVNAMSIHHYGYSRDDFLKMTIADMRPAEDIPKLMKKVSEIGKGISRTGVWRHLKRDGTLIHVEITSHSIDYLGKNARLVLANDVTERVRAEERLQQQYAMLQSIIESTDALIFSTDHNGLYTSFNKSHAAVMKLTNGEDIEIGKNILDYIREETEHEIIKQNLGRVLRGQSFSTEHSINTYPPMILEVSHNPIRSVSGDVVGAAIFARDITERKQTECSLKESETFFRLMFQNNPIPMWIYDSETLRFLEVNEAALKNYGYTRDEFLSITAADIRPDEDVQEFIRVISKLPEGSNQSDIKRHRRKDGTIVYVETVSDRMDFLGKNVRLVIANDVTQRVVSQHRLMESQHRLSLALQAANAGVWEWKLDDKKMFWTEECYRVMGLNPKTTEPSYRNWLNSIYSEDREHARFILAQAFENCNRFDVEYRIVLPDGKLRWIRNIGYAEDESFDNTCKTQHMIGLQIDITDQKQAEEHLNDQYSILRSIMESVDAAIFSLDRGFHYTSFNMNHACIMKAIYGADIEIGRNILDYMTNEEDRNKAKKNIERALWGERFTTEDYSGDELYSRQYFEISHNPIKTQLGKLLGVVVFAKDITERKTAEDTLKQQNEFLNNVIDSLNHPFYVIDVNTYKIRIANKATMLPAGAEITCHKLTHQSELSCESPDHPCPVREIGKTKQPMIIEHTHYDSDGNHKFVEVHAHPIFDAYGNVAQVIEYIIDITERKNKDEELQRLAMELDQRVTERTAEVHDLYNNAPCGYHSLDADGVIVRINDTELNWLGYTREEIIGKKTFDQIICNPKLFIENFPHFKQRGWVKDLEFKMVRKDGSMFPALLSATAITDSEGKYLMSRSIMFDITEFKKIEQKLRESEERFRVAIKNSPLMVFMQDRNLRYTWAYNQHPAFSSEEIIGKTDDDLLPESAAIMNRIKGMVLKTGQGIRQEVLVNIKGKHFFHDLTVEPLIDANEQIVGVVSASMNITTHKMLEEKLRQRSEELGIVNAALEKAARLKDEFLASMSHELRTPLTGVISLSEALLEEVYGDLNEKQRKTIRTIESSGHHLLDLITDILDLSKIEAGQMELQIEKTSVGDICQSALQLIKGLANKKHHNVSFGMNLISASIDADPRRLKQMLVNLLSNAVKFTPEHGEISLEVRGDEAEQMISFSIRDTGIGIAAEMFPMLFKPFVQLDSKLSRQYSGTGLGLSLVHRMAELHGGSVDLESEVGKGSCFTIRLPWKISAQSQPEDSDDMIIIGQEVDEERRHEALILLVEDNEINISLYSDYLQSRGYDVRVARNGAEGIQKAREIIPSLILMDIQMPGTDGLEAIRVLKSDSNAGIALIPIIALTSLAMPGDKEQCLASGADDYLSKPVSLKYLMETIEKYLVLNEVVYESEHQ